MSALKDTGLQNIARQISEHIVKVHVGDDVLNDPFLKHNATSQLALLSDELYQAGLRRIQQASQMPMPAMKGWSFVQRFLSKRL